MRRYLLIIIAMISLSVFVSAQVEMKGRITDANNGEPIQFINVILYDIKDTTKLVKGTITDLKGEYTLENVIPDIYRIVVSNIEYTPFIKELRVSMPSSGDVLIRNFELRERTYQLSEVAVTAQRKTQYVDKATYTFSQEDVKKARYAKDLLETLPQLTIDVQTQQITTLSGGNVKILLNGAEASDNQLKLIPPDKLLRVEYYDIPPARYATAGTVVNVITKPLDDGYGGGFDLLHAFTTGFGNDNAYFRFNRGKSQFDLEYSVNYRNYKNREKTNYYDYNLLDDARSSQYYSRDTFGYTDNRITLRYTNLIADKYLFQLSLKPNIQARFSHGTSTNEYTANNITESRVGTFDSKTNILSPVIDMYYWTKLPDENEITFDLTGTMFRTRVNEENMEYLLPSYSVALEDLMGLENRKQSLIGEVAHTKKFADLNRLNSGYKIESSWLNSDISNLFGYTEYKSRYLTQYIYSEYSGSRDRFNYRLSLGFTQIYNLSYGNEYNKLLFTPNLVLGYNITDEQSIRLILTREPIIPSVSSLSNNATLIVSDLIRRGNPMLRSGSETTLQLKHSIVNKYIDLTTVLAYGRSSNPINQYFVEDDNYIALTYENATSSELLGGFVSGDVKPFGKDIFTIKVSAVVLQETLKSPIIGTVHNLYIPVSMVVGLNFKNLSLSYRQKIPSFSLEGAFLERDENASHFFARYKKGNFSITSGVYWLFTPSTYKSKSLSQSIVEYTSTTKIWDNRNMVVVGFGWNFSSGKTNTVKRNISNSDNDAVTF